MKNNNKKIDMQSLPVSERAKLATTLGEEVGKVIDRALSKANKMLAKYGYKVSVTLNFHEVEDDKKE